MQRVLLLLVALMADASSAKPFTMPAGFEGIWQGTPSFNVLGPWDQNITFSIAKSPNGDYLMEDIIQYDTDVYGGWGWQRFYIEANSEKSGLLWYCSNTTLWGYFEKAGGRPGADSFSLESVTASSVTWCFSDLWDHRFTTAPFPSKAQGAGGCTGCDCANFTISLSPQKTLTVDYRIAGGPGHTHSKHLLVELERLGPAHPVREKLPPHYPDFKCDFALSYPNFTEPPPSTQSRCPFRKPRPVSSPKLPAPTKEYDHCYILNRRSNYKLQWTLDRAQQQLHVQVSAKSSAQGYVAFGFRPLARAVLPNSRTPWPSFFPANLTTQVGVGTKFGMIGADIVVGSSAGVSTMYAALYTGPPVMADYLAVSDAKVAYNSAAGEMVLSFRRPLISGYLKSEFPDVLSGLSQAGVNGTIDSELSDNIWAVGEFSNGFPMYHEANRGLSDFDWSDPTLDSEYNMC